MRIVVVGAGLAGLTAARQLVDSGHDVVVLDKGRSPGGRLATRRIGGAHLDHGAQFFTVRADAFAAQVAAWLAAGLAREWCRGFGLQPDGHPRYCAPAGMTSLAKDLAAGLDVRCSTLVFSVRPGRRQRWQVVIDDATTHAADAVVLTCPLPQSWALLVEAGVEEPESLLRTDYDRTLALLAVLDRPGAVPSPGGVQSPGSTFSFIADNAAKGISAVPAITFHAAAEWSQQHWDESSDDAAALLLEAAAPWLAGAAVIESQLKRWRFATPRTIWPDPCWQAPDGLLVLAGDAFAGPKIEGAYNSGLAAARALVDTA